MGRLIDADDALQRFIKEAEASGRGCIHINTIKRLLQDIDTAYDVKKAVAEMERIKNDASQGCDEVSHDKCNTYKNCADCIFDRTIDIIKKCGIPAAEQEEGE